MCKILCGIYDYKDYIEKNGIVEQLKLCVLAVFVMDNCFTVYC